VTLLDRPGARHDATAPIWVVVASLDDLDIERGAAATIGGQQVALFRVIDAGADRVFALDNLDPFSGAHVMSRGIVGDRGGTWKVASPIYKQQFSLVDGTCFDNPSAQLTTYPTRIRDGLVEIEWPRP
jgi:nitrite reductase (NADH) small subunit